MTFTPPNVSLPSEFTFKNPLTGGNSKAPVYKGGDIVKNPAAIYVLPKSYDAVCPSEVSSQSAQLAAQLGNLLRDIKGEQKVEGIEQDTKPGLLERADRLV